MPLVPLPRRLAAEFLGSALLAAVVIGSAIAAARLSSDGGVQLLASALVTALGLTVLILVLAPVSGAHLNPVVTAVDAALGGRPWADVARYLPVQLTGCVSGAVLANLMFGLEAAAWSTTSRASWPHALGEVVATAGLVLVVFALVRTGRPALAAPAVGAYIGAAYLFTSSTAFANPALTVGRMLTDTAAGIAPSSAPVYLAAQLIGAVLGGLIVRALFPVTGDPPPAVTPSRGARGSSASS